MLNMNMTTKTASANFQLMRRASSALVVMPNAFNANTVRRIRMAEIAAWARSKCIEVSLVKTMDDV